jgi:hypothetical protein
VKTFVFKNAHFILQEHFETIHVNYAFSTHGVIILNALCKRNGSDYRGEGVLRRRGARESYQNENANR